MRSRRPFESQPCILIQTPRSVLLLREDTVERNILDLAAKQGLSLYTRDNAAGTLNVTPFAADADKKKVDAPAKKVQKGDFVYK